LLFIILLGLKNQPIEEDNAIADCLGNLVTPHDLCDENHERNVEARVQRLFEVADNTPPRKSDVQKLAKFIKTD